MNFDSTIKTKSTTEAKNAMIQRSSVTYGNKLDTDILNSSEFSKELSSAQKNNDAENNVQAEVSQSQNSQPKDENKPKNVEVSENTDEISSNNEDYISCAVSKTEYGGNKTNDMKSEQSQPAQDLLKRNIDELLNTGNLINNINNPNYAQNGFFNIAPAIDYTNISMSAGDAKFFVDLVQNSDKTMQGIVKELQAQIEKGTEEIQTTSRISQTLLNTIKEGLKTNQPFRIDFGKDVSVILQIDKNGAITANFIPGNTAVEQYLRNNIDYLRQTFDEENLPYNSLGYSGHKQKQDEKNKRNSKESA